MIILGQSEAKSDLDAGIATQAYATQRFIEGTFLTTKLVMCLAHTIDADADVVITDIDDIFDVIFRDQGTIRRQADVKPLLFCML